MSQLEPVKGPFELAGELLVPSCGTEQRVQHHIDQVRQIGYSILPQAFIPQTISALVDAVEALWAKEAGSTLSYSENGVRRLENLESKGRLFLDVVMHPTILAVGQALMSEPMRLSMLKARDPLLGNPRQVYHRDCSGDGLPDHLGYYSFTAIVALDNATAENGSTIVLPFSQNWNDARNDLLRDRTEPYPGEVSVFAERGDVVLLNGHTWHAGDTNQSGARRRSILLHFYADRIERTGRYLPVVPNELRAHLSNAELSILGLDE